jgi:hypothetical protein
MDIYAVVWMDGCVFVYSGGDGGREERREGGREGRR